MLPVNIKSLRIKYKVGSSFVSYHQGPLHRATVKASAASVRAVSNVSGLDESDAEPARRAVEASREGRHWEAYRAHQEMQHFHEDASMQIEGLADGAEEGSAERGNFMREAKRHEELSATHSAAANGHAGVHHALERGREMGFHAEPANGRQCAMLADFLEDRGTDDHGEVLEDYAERLRRAVHPERKGK